MYEMDGRIRFSEIGCKGELTNIGLVNYFQDCNTFQAEDLGYHREYYQSINRGWVLSGWQIVIHRMPLLGEAVKVCTWPYAFKGFIGYRNYTMDSKAGERLAEANAIWTLLDLEKRCPVRVTEQEAGKYVMSEKLSMNYAPRHIKTEGEGVRHQPVLIGKERLDTNFHMNNAQYIGIANEFISSDIEIGQIRVEYKKEVKYGTKVVPVVYVQDGRETVVFEDEEETVLAIVEFEERKV